MTNKSKNSRIYSSGVASTAGERYWKRIMIVDDYPDITNALMFGIENATKTSGRRIVVDPYNDPRKALLDFQPNFYDLLLIDI